MRAGKIIAHDRAGQGKIGAARLTVLRPGPLGDHGAGRAADMYVDCSPYLSLEGVDIKRKRDPRGNTMRAHDESHIQTRTGGRHRGSNTDARSHHGGLVTKE